MSPYGGDMVDDAEDTNGTKGTNGSLHDETGEPVDEEPAPVRPVDRFRRTAAGSVVAAGLFGLRDALEGRPEREEVQIVNEAPESNVEPGFVLEFDEELGKVKVVLAEPLPDEDPRKLL